MRRGDFRRNGIALARTLGTLSSLRPLLSCLARRAPLEGIVLLESAVDQAVGTYPDARNPGAWEDYLLEQASAHPLFRRRQISLLGGKGRVVLTGRVASYYEKQLAQEFLRRCDGVQHIDNRIEVAYGEPDHRFA